MERKHVVDKRSVRLEKVLESDYIPFLGGRPARETVIGNEDVIDLSIALNTCRTLEELFEHA